MYLVYATLALMFASFMSTAADKDTTITKEVFLDINIGGQSAGRIVLGLFGDTAPKTVANFVALAGMEVRC